MGTARIPFPPAPQAARLITRGLLGLIDLEAGPTAEQRHVLEVIASHLLGQASGSLAGLEALGPEALAAALVDPPGRRLFLQMGIILDLCHHPGSEEQLRRLERYAQALHVDPPQLQSVRDLAHLSAEAATARYVRRYDAYKPELSEPGSDPASPGEPQDPEAFFAAVERLAVMPTGSLGWAFVQFYARNGMTIPNRHTPSPSYYVSHDMNHVIAGYEPTGPGEVALGAFKLAMHDSEANWMASLTNFLIHEVGLFKHGGDAQFVPYGGGGEPYHGVEGRCGVLALPGATELFAEALERGARCRGDFSQLDHLAIASEPLREIRRRFHVLPLREPMVDQPDLWPDPSEL